MVSTITQDYFNTEQGLDQLIVGTYNAERVNGDIVKECTCSKQDMIVLEKWRY